MELEYWAFQCLAQKKYALDEGMYLDTDGIKNFLDVYQGETIFLFGFTFMIWQHFYKELIKTGYRPDFSKTILIHGGGWKKLLNESVSPDEFKKCLNEICGIGVDNIHDYYGMVEQTGAIYMECEYGHLHTSNFSDVIIRRPSDFSAADIQEKGIIEVVSLLPQSYPGHVLLTEDEGVVLGEDDCLCGRKGKYFKVNGRIKDFTLKINDALYRRWRELHPLQVGERETLAYDITSILFFGVQCPLAELGRNSKGIKQLQANLALIVSRKEKYPLTHFVYEGSSNDVSTIKNLLYRLQESSLESGTLIWDRGNVSNEIVNAAENANWNLICGIPGSSKEAREIISSTDIPYSWNSLIRSSKKGHIYAMKVLRKLYGKERSLTVYANREREIHDSDARNETLSSIEEELQLLANSDHSISEKKIREKAKKIIGGNDEFIEFSICRKSHSPRVKWKIKKKEVREAEKRDGKYLLLSTDASLTAKEVVNTYVEKDFIEKVFCTLKTCEEMEPVRHRLENRVRAYLFVCVLAYRLLAALQYNLQMISNQNNGSWESANSFLARLGRVERVNVRLGQQVKTWYLNITRKDQQTLKKMGFKDLIKEIIEVDFRV